MIKELKLGLEKGAEGILTSRSKQPKILAKVKQKMLRISSHA
jgi:hypothetical protein